jgi:hypothetical protein
MMHALAAVQMNRLTTMEPVVEIGDADIKGGGSSKGHLPRAVRPPIW